MPIPTFKRYNIHGATMEVWPTSYGSFAAFSDVLDFSKYISDQLQKYGRHLDGCSYGVWQGAEIGPGKCTCGFFELVAKPLVEV